MLKGYCRYKTFLEQRPTKKSGDFELIVGVSGTAESYVQNLRQRQRAELKNVLWLQSGFGSTLDPRMVVEAKNIYHQVLDGKGLFKLEQTLLETIRQYRSAFPNETESMIENVGVKLILWMESLVIQLEGGSEELFFYGPVKKHEWFFLYWMHLLGMAVTVENPCGDNRDPLGRWFPNLSIKTLENSLNDLPKLDIQPLRLVNSPLLPVSGVQAQTPQKKREHDYETLAKLSESVVMIRVYDETGTPVASGSGVVLNGEGYLLTNFHVVCHGTTYGVFFENDPEEYPSTGMIKYHTDFDIALIRVRRTTKPLPLGETPLVRGQRIAAIGSPLGLINTISDGIVSGFRNFKDVDMIQFTAPISSGSSGGALLNLYGELVGVTTAGFEGQNLNLAVPVSYIRLFAGNHLNP